MLVIHITTLISPLILLKRNDEYLQETHFELIDYSPTMKFHEQQFERPILGQIVIIKFS